MQKFISLLLIVIMFFACMLCLSYLLIFPFTDFSVAVVYMAIMFFGFFSLSTVMLINYN